jgi:hypothetical protein
MGRYYLQSTLLALVTTLASVWAPPAAHASSINDLRVNYAGTSSSTSHPESEIDNMFQLQNIVKQGNGKFTATSAGLFSFSGNVSTKGKITFKGSFNDTVGMVAFKLTFKGSALLSVTGRYIGGQISIDGTKNGVPYHDLETYFLVDSDLSMMSAPSGERRLLNLF